MAESLSEAICDICFEEAIVQKFLPCQGNQHHFCEHCIATYESQGRKDEHGERVFPCPKCRQEVILPNGQTKSLKTKFFVKLTCENCSGQQHLDNTWWCYKCSCQVCGGCAMKKHRDHECLEFERYDVPKECVSFFDNIVKNPDAHVAETAARIDLFCGELKEKLMSLCTNVESLELASDLSSAIKTGFGLSGIDQEPAWFVATGSDVEKIKKKLNLTLKVLNAVEKKQDQKKDADEILAKIRQKPKIVFPHMDKVLNLFREDKGKADEEVLKECSQLVVAAAAAAFPAQPLVSLKVRKLVFVERLTLARWFESNCRLTFIYDERRDVFVFATDDGISVVQSSELGSPRRDAVFYVKPWTQRKRFHFPPQICYHHKRDTYFVSISGPFEQTRHHFFELTLNTKGWEKIDFPPDNKFGGNHMVGVFRNGQIVSVNLSRRLCSIHVGSLFGGEGSAQCNWKRLCKMDNSRMQFERFSQIKLHVFNEQEYLLVSGTHSIYCFGFELDGANRIVDCFQYEFYPGLFDPKTSYAIINNTNMYAEFKEWKLKRFLDDSGVVSDIERPSVASYYVDAVSITANYVYLICIKSGQMLKYEIN